jgi:hypothetical protein
LVGRPAPGGDFRNKRLGSRTSRSDQEVRYAKTQVAGCTYALNAWVCVVQGRLASLNRKPHPRGGHKLKSKPGTDRPPAEFSRPGSPGKSHRPPPSGVSNGRGKNRRGKFQQNRQPISARFLADCELAKFFSGNATP